MYEEEVGFLAGGAALAGDDEIHGREALRLAAHKLPVKCKFVKREGLEEA